MIRSLTLFLALACLCPFAGGQDIKLISASGEVQAAPSTVITGQVGQFLYIRASSTDPKAKFGWAVFDAGLVMQDPSKLLDRNEACFVASFKGTFRIAVYDIDHHEQDPTIGRVVIGDAPVPVPPGPIPPGPIPPDPPKPPDPPGPRPIPEAGFHVLIVYESATMASLPKAQAQILAMPKSLRDYLNAKCVKVNQVSAWRAYDKDTTVTTDSIWKTALARPRATLPWIIISNDTAGFEGPLPANLDDTLALLKKYGGD